MNESSGETDISRLGRWQNERPIIRLLERIARKKIVSAIQRDVARGEENRVNPENVLKRIKGSLKRLGVQGEKKGIIAQYESLDGMTASQIIREPEAWVAREVDKKTERAYTCAKIGTDGSTSLTLNFEQLGPERNPQIVDSHTLPEATTVTFNLLVDVVIKQSKSKRAIFPPLRP